MARDAGGAEVSLRPRAPAIPRRPPPAAATGAPRPRAPTPEPDAGRQIGTDFEPGAPPAMKLRHPLLADRVHAGEDLLRGRDGVVIEMTDKIVRRLPGFRIGLAHDDVQPDAEGEPPPL